MSGPKKSSWEIRQEIKEERRREREHKRNLQLDDIYEQLRTCQQQAQKLHSEYGQYADFTLQRINEWSSDVEINAGYDLRDAWRGLKGIQNFIFNQSNRLSQNAQNALQRQTERENRALQRQEQKDAKAKAEQQRQDAIAEKQRLKEEAKRLKEEKIARTIASLTSIRDSYPSIINPGIEQRIELFSNSLKVNPDNQQTKNQIKAFRKQLKKEINKYEEQQDNIQHIKEAFSSALGSEPSDGEGGTSIINGEIEGVPISVQINKSGNDIKFDTPTDGSCKKGMNALINKLDDANIKLGTIQIINSGQTINNKTSTYRSNRTNA